MTPHRLTIPFDMALLLAAAVPPELHDNFSCTEWLADRRNVALAIGPNLGMFEYVEPGVYLGHIWFQSRGRVALVIARQMLDHMFEQGAREIRGETPIGMRHAWLFARMLGFRQYGEADSRFGRVYLSRLNGNVNRPETVVEQAIPAQHLL